MTRTTLSENRLVTGEKKQSIKQIKVAEKDVCLFHPLLHFFIYSPLLFHVLACDVSYKVPTTNCVAWE